MAVMRTGSEGRGKAGEPLPEGAPFSAMAAYKLYCLDNQGHITSRIDFAGDCDGAAIAHVRQHNFDSGWEIWVLGRLVAKNGKEGPIQQFASTAGSKTVQ